MLKISKNNASCISGNKICLYSWLITNHRRTSFLWYDVCLSKEHYKNTEGLGNHEGYSAVHRTTAVL